MGSGQGLTLALGDPYPFKVGVEVYHYLIELHKPHLNSLFVGILERTEELSTAERQPQSEKGVIIRPNSPLLPRELYSHSYHHTVPEGGWRRRTRLGVVERQLQLQPQQQRYCLYRW